MIAQVNSSYCTNRNQGHFVMKGFSAHVFPGSNSELYIYKMASLLNKKKLLLNFWQYVLDVKS
jgi:hypothetical protein